MVIAVAGKGGTGKTTVAALIIEVLLRQNKKPILAVDADPNSTLGDYLGIRCHCTISDIIEETKGLRNLPDGVSKPTHLEYQLQRAITETKGVDLLVMGRPEGPECYCMANNILRGYLQKISSNYPYVVIDNEAGMEHLSRKTTQNIDALILVSDPTKIGLQTAKRIRELIDKMASLNIRKKYLLVNKVTTNFSDAVFLSLPCAKGRSASGGEDNNIEKITGLKVIGYLPYSEAISQQELVKGSINISQRPRMGSPKGYSHSEQMEQVKLDFNPASNPDKVCRDNYGLGTLLIKPMTEIIERLFKYG